MAANKTEQATLGGGCFWCVESAFLQVKGIESVKSGYTGGHTENPCFPFVFVLFKGSSDCLLLSFKCTKLLTVRYSLPNFISGLIPN